ncbi:MAG TPA: hypothetical protein VHA75_06300 [Rugosimonospora sp.]|nr:hypothetical protein [Rugosimonospora sp.]
MFDRIGGLPAHPLIVHAAVVFVPLLVLLTLGYALLPKLRSRLDWATAALAVLAPLTVFLARESGKRFEVNLYGNNIPAQVTKHFNYGTKLFVFVLILGGLALLMVVIQEGRRRGRFTVPGPIALVVTVLAALSVVPAGIYVYLTGESGAHAVWGAGQLLNAV